MEELSLNSVLWRGIAVILLVLANAFFVSAEFALVASRRTRIDAMVRRGDRKAKRVQKAIQSLDKYISGTQLGITLASLGLGWIGEPAVAGVLERAFTFLPNVAASLATHTTAVALAFLGITFLHIVLGELAPKALALLHPESTSRLIAGPLIGFTEVTNPFIWLLNGSANLILKLVGARPPTEGERVHQPEEIVMLAEQSQRSGQLDTQDVELIQGVFKFSEKLARDVMTPRTEIIAIHAGVTIAETVDIIAESRRSRYPIYGESLDDITGVIHAKDVLSGLKESKFQPVESLMRKPFFVPGTREVEDVLTDMKRLNCHMAIVLDEYGGTAGLVTMEDLLEEIVGQIYDEYDRADTLPTPEGGGVVLPGDTELEDVNATYGLELSEEHYITIGGYVFGELGRLPRVGDSVRVKGGRLEVLEMDGKRVHRLKLFLPGGASGAGEVPPG